MRLTVVSRRRVSALSLCESIVVHRLSVRLEDALRRATTFQLSMVGLFGGWFVANDHVTDTRRVTNGVQSALQS